MNRPLSKLIAVLCGVCVKYILIPLSFKLTEIEMDLNESLNEVT